LGKLFTPNSAANNRNKIVRSSSYFSRHGTKDTAL
jgi:hypothetical protein